MLRAICLTAIAAERRDPGVRDDGLDIIVRRDEVVELDEQRRALHRVDRRRALAPLGLETRASPLSDA